MERIALLVPCELLCRIVNVKPLPHIIGSVSDPDAGSGAFLIPGSRIRKRFFPDPGSRIPDLGSRIPNPYFLELNDNFLGKRFHNSLKIGPNFFLQHFKTTIIFYFVKFVAT
jgi:hypothetical protein